METNLFKHAIYQHIYYKILPMRYYPYDNDEEEILFIKE